MAASFRSATLLRGLLAVSVIFFPVLVHAQLLLAPPAETAAPSRRLPTGNNAPTDVDQGVGLDVTLHAAGAVELTLPKEWQSYETPLARDVRLVITPQPMEKNPSSTGNGLWLVYHAVPAPVTLLRDTKATPAIQQELAEELERRMALATNQFAKTTHSRNIVLDGWPALQYDFEVADPADAADAQPFWKGFHCLVRTPWGLVEIHAVAPADEYAQREVGFTAILNSLLLRKPHLPSREPEERLADAMPIQGAWKAYRSRLRLYHDGEIELVYDPPRELMIDDLGKVIQRQDPPMLAGRYTAQGDVLFITWRDGSLLNYRWKLKDGQLLLTDHAGKHSLLKPLYE